MQILVSCQWFCVFCPEVDDAQLNPADMNEMDVDKPQCHVSKTDSQAPAEADSIPAGRSTEKRHCEWWVAVVDTGLPVSCHTGALTEVTRLSEQISTEDNESFSADISVNANKTAGALSFIFYR